MAFLGDIGKFAESTVKFLTTGQGPSWAKYAFPVNYAAGRLFGTGLSVFSNFASPPRQQQVQAQHDTQLQYVVPPGYQPGYGSQYPYDITGYNFEDPYSRGGPSPWDYSTQSPAYLTPPPVVETVSYPTYSAPSTPVAEDQSLLELAPLLFL